MLHLILSPRYGFALVSSSDHVLLAIGGRSVDGNGSVALNSGSKPHSILGHCYSFFKEISFIFNFLFHNSHEKFDRQIINEIESWRKHRCFVWVQKIVFCHQGSNSWSRAWHSIPMIRAECDTTYKVSDCFLVNPKRSWYTHRERLITKSLDKLNTLVWQVGHFRKEQKRFLFTKKFFLFSWC